MYNSTICNYGTRASENGDSNRSKASMIRAISSIPLYFATNVQHTIMVRFSTNLPTCNSMLSL